MTEVQKEHTEYSKQINKITEINEEIEQVGNVIHGLKNQINQANKSIEGINSQLLTAPVNVANGSLTSDEYMALKKELREQEGIIKDLSELIAIQEEGKLGLIGNGRSYTDHSKLGLAKNKLERVKVDLVKALVKQTTDKVILAAKDEIKSLAYLIASDQKYNHAYDSLGGDFYTDLGEVLCLSIFGRKNGTAPYPDATFQEAREACEDMIDQL